MDFSSFKIETKNNPSQVVSEKEVKVSTRAKSTTKKKSTSYSPSVNSSIRHDRRSFKPSADYSMYKKVTQSCERCDDITLHILNKAQDKIRCTICSFTYNLI